MTSQTLLLFVGAITVVLVLDYVLRRTLWSGRRARAESQARRLLNEARSEAETYKKEAELAAQEKFDQLEAAAVEAEQKREEKLTDMESRLGKRRSDLDRETARLKTEATAMERSVSQLAGEQQDLERRVAAARLREEEVSLRLQEVAGLTRDEARERLMAEMVERARADSAADIRRVQEETRSTLDERLREMTGRAIQRISTGGLVESTVSVIRLPSDDMKGRIIGREGRNIRSIEMTTGIDLIVDDTPQAILISCFDPLRREVARIAIEHLVEDGRIHPARIEELVEKTRDKVEEIITETGEAAFYEMGLQEVNAKLVSMLGRLKYHTTSGQNLLQHCRETADLAGLMALELGFDPEVPRRAGLLHEVSQAADERPRTHSILASADLAGRLGESDEVQHAIAAAHPDVSPRKVEAALVQMACRVSRSRSGARKHNLETFISRMRRLEQVAASFPGVSSAHAFRAGKELRVLVESEKVTDAEARALSRDIASRIQKEVDYPGQVRISVLRETRTVDYAL